MRIKVEKIIGLTSACLPAITFMVWVCAYYWLLRGDRFKAFLQPKLRPLLLMAMILLLMFAVASIAQLLRKNKQTQIWQKWLRAAILFLPALFIWAVYGQSLGTHALTQKAFDIDEIISLPQTTLEHPSGPDSPALQVSLVELFKDSEQFEGKRVTTEGMVYRRDTDSENTFKIFRFVIFCCAADALPLSISIHSRESKNLENEAWVKVAGKLRIMRMSGRQMLSIDADGVDVIPTPPPEKQYLYFY